MKEGKKEGRGRGRREWGSRETDREGKDNEGREAVKKEREWGGSEKERGIFGKGLRRLS